MMRIVGVLLFLLLGSSALALPEFWDVFKAHYQPPGTASCTFCHVSPKGGVRNLYGKSVEAQLGGADMVTVKMLQAIETQDSDGDGKTNLEEIQSGGAPGVAEAAPAEAAGTGGTDLVPKHTFHPLIVHFPIGIYLFAVFTEFWGWRKKDDEMRRVALFGLWIGLLATFFGVISGITAMLRMGLALEGTLLIHFIIGLTSLALAFGVVWWRRRVVPVSNAYWFLLALSGIGIALTGHFGAMMVWN